MDAKHVLVCGACTVGRGGITTVLWLGYSSIDAFAAGGAATYIGAAITAERVAPTDRKERIVIIAIMLLIYSMIETFHAFYPVDTGVRIWVLSGLVAAVLLLVGARKLYLRN